MCKQRRCYTYVQYMNVYVYAVIHDIYLRFSTP